MTDVAEEGMEEEEVAEEVTEEEMMGNSLPPFSPLGTYFTPAVNKSPFSTTLVPMIGS